MNRSTRNRLFKALLLKAGFRIEPTYEVTPLVAQVRKSTHQHLCGMDLLDYRDAIQIGTNERDATPRKLSDLPTISRVRLAKDGNIKVWLLAPGAAYAAFGFSFHLSQLIRLAEEDRDRRQARVDQRAARLNKATK